MDKMIKLDGQEYDAANLSDNDKARLVSLQYVITQIKERQNMLALLNRAKKSYIDDLKQEVLSTKAGFLLGDD
jgi:hypothetical protein